MKSFRCRPLRWCIHHLMVVFPHSVKIAGWWSSPSAISPTCMVNAKVSAKSLNSKLRFKKTSSPSCIRFQPGTRGKSSWISNSDKGGSPPLHGIQSRSARLRIFQSPSWVICRKKLKTEMPSFTPSLGLKLIFPSSSTR